ncbi:MAG: AmmeMemoRadiSam system protein B [Candidatus Methanofastidiosa archaeon]|nr:AmmeMemoRadiSam system protein B [Candidatus Methanofastidiosa archaeon]
MIRESVAAGGFYPAAASDIANLIEKYQYEASGAPKSVKKSKGVVCGLSPHAGYIYSGRTAAHFYSSLAKDMPDRFIVIGPNHTGRGRPISLMAEGKWRTPLGEVPIDTDIATSLLEQSDLISDDYRAHQMEHSIEVQLPFLQYLRNDITFVPICLGLQDLDSAIEVSQAIRNSVDDNIGVIASSDLVHFGLQYGYRPFIGNEKQTLEWIERNDRQVLTLVEERDVDGLYDFIANLNYTMCGYGAAAISMLVATQFGLKGSILNYSTSYSTSRDTNIIVGYGSVIFR